MIKGLGFSAVWKETAHTGRYDFISFSSEYQKIQNKFSMRTLKFLLQKEFRQIFRNTMILRMIIAMPIIQLLVMPLAADFEIKNINISLLTTTILPTRKN
jgi:hypothetical protein